MPSLYMCHHRTPVDPCRALECTGLLQNERHGSSTLPQENTTGQQYLVELWICTSVPIWHSQLQNCTAACINFFTQPASDFSPSGTRSLSEPGRLQLLRKQQTVTWSCCQSSCESIAGSAGSASASWQGSVWSWTSCETTGKENSH